MGRCSVNVVQTIAMTASLLAPPVTPLPDLPAVLARQGYGVLSAASVRECTGLAAAQLDELLALWADLPPDAWLKDGGKYRQRRHASYVARGDALHDVPHRAHWQPLAYNALHGGLERWFEPLHAADAARPAWRRLLLELARLASRSEGRTGTDDEPWYIEAHPFRISTAGGIGRPTPEGAHRDGVDWVAVFLVSREGIKGGETRVFDAHGPQGQRFTLREPWSLLWLDDRRVIHETTPLQPLTSAIGHRDTLVVTLRRHGLQDATMP